MSRANSGLSPRILSATIPVAFVVIVAGPNLPNPLLPLYGRTLGLDPADLSIVYSSFLIALTITLAAMARPRMQSRPGAALVAALLMAVVADLVLSLATHPALIVGRALNGISLGLGTGAAASLALALRGERARTLAATGTIVGAVVGSIIAVTLAQFGPAPLIAGYAIHAAVTCAALIAVIVGLVRWPRSSWALDRQVAINTAVPRDLPARWTGYLMGSLAWISGGIIVALVPLAISQDLNTTSLLIAGLGTIALLVFANIGQFSVGGRSIRHMSALAMICMGAGVVIIAASVAAGLVPFVVLGCAFVGFGQGAGYRLGLRIASAGLTPRLQGGRASVYACISYAACALFVIAGGEVATRVGLTNGLWIVAAVLTPLFVVAASTASRRARERVPQHE
ncbi:MAG: quinolone resistance protein norA [Subtercola sp.]|nr:quinolone resistance protein norA [Subtercola sp.]